MKKALTVILTIICGLLANIIAAVFPVWALLASDNIVFGVLVGLPIACGLAALLNLIGKEDRGEVRLGAAGILAYRASAVCRFYGGAVYSKRRGASKL